MRTKTEHKKAPAPDSPAPEAPPPGIRITSGRTKDEIGRVHHTDGAWHAFAREASGRYRALGPHPDFASALSVIPDAAIPAEREAERPQAARPRRRPPAPESAQPKVAKTAKAARPASVPPKAIPSTAAQSGRARAVRSNAA
jgi:hypothetical protein